jgi:hypothetical protein
MQAPWSRCSALQLPTQLLAGACAVLLVGCGGGGAGAATTPAPTPTPPPIFAPTPVTLSGAVTYDRVPFSTTAGAGLDLDRPASSPARGVTVEAISAASQASLATAATDASGQYTLTVPASTDVFLRARAEIRRTGTPAYALSVRDNTSADALYTLDSATFNTGTVALVRNLVAQSGWSSGAGYTGTRAAAPFAILDAAYDAVQLVLGAAPTLVFPELRLYWSPRNIDCIQGTTAGQPSCDGSAAALARGEIETSFYENIAGRGPSIYVLGAASSDTDEFDRHVLAHEWGHYYQDSFSRDDSIGGSHALSDRLDLRVAFSEGWGNAFAGMVRGDPVFRDSFVQQGLQRDSAFNVDQNPQPPVQAAGWYKETSVEAILYDIFDRANGASADDDGVALGFAPLHAAMTGAVRTSPAFTSIYTLVGAVRAANPGAVPALDQLVAGQSIATGADDFGSGETNGGSVAGTLPVYAAMSSGVPKTLCSRLPSSQATQVYNKLGNRAFMRFDVVANQTGTLAASGPAGSDPDLVLYQRGVFLRSAESAASGSETLPLSSLAAGTYVAEIYEATNIDTVGAPRGDTCFTVTLTLN